MGNACGGDSNKKTTNIPRDYQPAQSVKSDEIDRAVAKEETTTSYENITKVFSFKKELGHGNFGTVRLSTMIGNPNMKFAIKAIEKAKIKKDLYLLKRELQILRRLDHPNVIKFYETYQDEKFFYFVMEYCSGGELLDKIAKEGRLKESEVCNIMQQAFSAIKHLHTIGIVHRDLKPENFLFASSEPNSDIKIIDFGLSKFLGDAPGGRLTTAAGTAIYMAPEVLKGNYDERSDNWSLGVLMYVLLCGSPPFEGDNANAVFQNILKLKYSMDGPEWKKISPQAKNLIKGLLIIKPEDRLTASTALGHDWFKNRIQRQTTSSQSNQKAVDMIKHFKGEKYDNDLMVEARKFMMNTLSQAEIKSYREMFQFLDVGGTGFVSLDSLKKTMEEGGVSNPEAEINHILAKTNANKSQGLMNYSAFLTVILDKKILYTDERLNMAFRHFDLKNSGEISLENIKEVIARSGRRVTEEDLKKMVKDVELKKPGKINFEEFKAILEN